MVQLCGGRLSARSSRPAEAEEQGGSAGAETPDAPVAAMSPGVVGWCIVSIGVGMAALPFLAPLVGIPLDGTVAWQWTRDRVFLHVVPGLAAAALGVVVVVLASRPSHTPATSRFVTALGGGAVFFGIWFGAGPWAYDVLVPGAGTSGLMFLAIPGFSHFSALHKQVVELACHWGPGILMMAAGIGVLGTGRANGGTPLSEGVEQVPEGGRA